MTKEIADGEAAEARAHKAGIKSGNKPLSDRDIFILAAMLSVSNMGQPMPEKRDIARLKTSQYPLTLSGAVLSLAQQYMETNEHEKIFLDEARGFVRDLRKTPLKCRKWWPHIFSAYEAA